MANLTDRYENKLLDGLVGTAQLSTPLTVYLALFSADPTDTGSVASEIGGGGYVRTSINGNFPTAIGTDGSVTNDTVINFPTATADWTTVTHMGFMESGTRLTDDMMLVSPLDTPITIATGQVFSYALGKLTVSAA